LRGRAAALLRLFLVEVFDDLRHVGEMPGSFAAGGEVGGVVFSESLDAAKHIVAACFTVIRWESG